MTGPAPKLTHPERAALQIIAQTPNGQATGPYLRRLMASNYDLPDTSDAGAITAARSLVRKGLAERAPGNRARYQATAAGTAAVAGDAPAFAPVDEVLAGQPATPVTRRLIRTALEGGLRPHLDLDPPPKRKGARRPQTYRVLLNFPARDGMFGALHISTETGEVLRANLCWGNDARETSYTTVADIRRQLNLWWRTQYMKEV